MGTTISFTKDFQSTTLTEDQRKRIQLLLAVGTTRSFSYRITIHSRNVSGSHQHVFTTLKLVQSGSMFFIQLGSARLNFVYRNPCHAGMFDCLYSYKLSFTAVLFSAFVDTSEKCVSVLIGDVSLMSLSQNPQVVTFAIYPILLLVLIINLCVLQDIPLRCRAQRRLLSATVTLPSQDHPLHFGPDPYAQIVPHGRHMLHECF